MGLIIIHIGKCGGSVIYNTLVKNNIQHTHIHIRKVVFKKNNKYVILLRNPISRFISAFNWRYKLVILDKTQENRFLFEKDALIKYKDVNNLSENIDNYDRDTEYIHHIYEDIDYYLNNFLQECKSTDILGVITQENLNNDFKNIFNIDIDETVKSRINDGSLSKYISDSGTVSLKKYLWKDYKCIEKLYEMKCLTKEQFDILSK
jgi:hypothetical protein